MKKGFFLKLFVSSLLLVGSIYLNKAYCQKSDATISETEAIRIVKANRANNPDVKDINLIYPGQILSYVFEDGSKYTDVVQKDDYQIKIVRRISAMEKIHGPVVPVLPVVNPDPKKTDDGALPGGIVSKNGGFNWLVFLLALAIIALVVGVPHLLRKNKERKEKAKTKAEETPVLAPMVSGGINDAQAPSYMQGVARRKNYTITGPTERILLTTRRPIKMDYYGGMTSMKEFTNEPFYRAAARRNDNSLPCFAYFQEVCGNDGTCLDENDIIVTPITDQSPEIRRANLAVNTPMPATSSAQEVDQQQTTVNVYSELQMLMTAVKATEGKDSASVELTRPSFTFKFEFSKGIAATNHVQPKKEEVKELRES